MTKIAIIQRRIAPFRVPFFERLNAHEDTDVTVFHGNGVEDINLKVKTEKYTIKKLKILSLKINICYNLLLPLMKKKYDTIIFEGAIYNVPFLLLVPFFRLLGRKVYWWSCGWEPETSFILKKHLRDVLYRFASTCATATIVYSSRAKEYYHKLGNRLEKIFIAPNVLDQEVLIQAYNNIATSDIKKMREFYYLDNRKVILFVGKIEKNKRLDILLKAYRQLSSEEDYLLSLLIIGGGSELEKWKSWTTEHKLSNVHFVGEIRDLFKVAAFFRIADIFVMPGTGGLAIYHAMVYRLPVVVSTADGCEEDLIVKDKTGVFFKPNDARDLGIKIKQLLSNGDQFLKEMGFRAQKRVLNDFTMQKMIENYRKAINL